MQKSTCGFCRVTLEARYWTWRDLSPYWIRCDMSKSCLDLISAICLFLRHAIWNWWYLKRYVGGLVHSMNKQLHIDLLGLLQMRVSDYVRSASLFVRFLFLFWNWSTINRIDVPPEQRDDVQRFERQGYTVMYFNLRVWSWLRTNAGGMPNTCKSNEKLSSDSGKWRTGE